MKEFIVLYEAVFGRQVQKKIKSTSIEGAIVRICRRELIHENAILNVKEVTK
jgi:hypothetical protein